MKPITILYSLFLITFLIACNSQSGTESGLGDTLTTASGVQYVYLKKGEGRKVDTLSKVSTYLSLKVNDKVIWNTDELPDSIFSYVVGHTGLIKGFTEISYYLREGDEIVAILPPELAYGERGSGEVVPPNSTLIYDRFEVRNVTEPKPVLIEELKGALNTEGLEGLFATWEKAKQTGLNSYHIENQDFYRMWMNLTNTARHEDASTFAGYFSRENNDPDLGLMMLKSLMNSSKIDAAKDSLKSLLNSFPEDSAKLVGEFENMNRN